MSAEVKIPSVGESVSSGVISAWHKKTGDIVKPGDLLLTLDTDKVSSEITADAAGTLEITVPEGTEVKVGATVALIAETSAAAAPAPAAAPEKSAPAPAAAAPSVAPAAEAKVDKTETLSPAVRRIVEEEKISPAAVPATGKDGRLTKGDVLAHLQTRVIAPPAATTATAAPAPAEKPASALPQRVTRRAMPPLRRKIAAQLVSAQHTAALLTTFNEVDMTAVMELRKRLQESFTKRHGVKLGFMSFFVKAVTEALRAIPSVNGRIEGEEIIQNHFYDIGVAVGTEKGLIVPVIRDADQKSFAAIEKDIAAYAVKARDGKITLADLQGGVFTISNGGTYGSLLSTPIVNPPQSGILGMHKIQERPVVLDGQIVARPMMYLALSYDHRLVDGKEAVTFLVRVKECIEDPTRLLLEA